MYFHMLLKDIFARRLTDTSTSLWKDSLVSGLTDTGTSTLELKDTFASGLKVWYFRKGLILERYFRK